MHPQKKFISAIIGVFDGVHKGHLFLIKEALKLKAKEKLFLFTFNPHPDFVLGKAKPPYLLTTTEEKKEILKSLGLNRIFVLPFSKNIAAMLPEDFFQKYLLKKYPIKNLIIGYDFKLGKNKTGDYKYLKKIGKDLGIHIKQIKALKYGEKIISSSLIRKYLLNNQLNLANKLLGYNYFVTGKVIKGKSRGKKIGYPTANLKISNKKLLPVNGVYAGYVKLNHKVYSAVANSGYVPTFSGKKKSFEVYILNFTGNIYGKIIRFYFLKKIREEKKFNNLEKLKNQIKKDINLVKNNYLKNY